MFTDRTSEWPPYLLKDAMEPGLDPETIRAMAIIQTDPAFTADGFFSELRLAGD